MNRKNRNIAKGNIFTNSILPLLKFNKPKINNNTLAIVPINKDQFIKPIMKVFEDIILSKFKYHKANLPIIKN